MTIRLAALALLTFSCAAPAFAAADGAHGTHEAEQAADAKPAKERKVCRRETATGSVMPKRVCRTVAQIEQEQRDAERFRDQQGRMGAAGS